MCRTPFPDPDKPERELPDHFHAADISPESWTEPKQTGNYTAMVSRRTDGSDPLVQEPGP